MLQRWTLKLFYSLSPAGIWKSSLVKLVEAVSVGVPGRVFTVCLDTQSGEELFALCRVGDDASAEALQALLTALQRFPDLLKLFWQASDDVLEEGHLEDAEDPLQLSLRSAFEPGSASGREGVAHALAVVCPVLSVVQCEQH